VYPIRIQVQEVVQHHEPREVLLADVLRERSPSIHLQRRAKKSKKGMILKT